MRTAHLVFVGRGKSVHIADTSHVFIVEMAFEGVASAKLLPTAPDHHFTVPAVRCCVFWQIMASRVFKGDTTADPLRGTLETRVGADVPLEIGRTMVALDPLAVRTGPGVVPLGRRDRARNGLHVARRGRRARAF